MGKYSRAFVLLFRKINRTKFTLRCHYYAIAAATVKKLLSKVIS